MIPCISSENMQSDRLAGRLLPFGAEVCCTTQISPQESLLKVMANGMGNAPYGLVNRKSHRRGTIGFVLRLVDLGRIFYA